MDGANLPILCNPAQHSPDIRHIYSLNFYKSSPSRLYRTEVNPELRRGRKAKPSCSTFCQYTSRKPVDYRDVQPSTTSFSLEHWIQEQRQLPPIYSRKRTANRDSNGEQLGRRDLSLRHFKHLLRCWVHPPAYSSKAYEIFRLLGTTRRPLSYPDTGCLHIFEHFALLGHILGLSSPAYHSFRLLPATGLLLPHVVDAMYVLYHHPPAVFPIQASRS